jgi:Zn-dependent peptidase ImmA (M78 family)
MKPEVDFLIKDLRRELKNYNIKLILRKYKPSVVRLGSITIYKNGTGNISVYFYNMSFQKAMLSLAHEYAHFLQHKRGNVLKDVHEEGYKFLEIHTERKAISLLKEWKKLYKIHSLNIRKIKKMSIKYINSL